MEVRQLQRWPDRAGTPGTDGQVEETSHRRVGLGCEPRKLRLAMIHGSSTAVQSEGLSAEYLSFGAAVGEAQSRQSCCASNYFLLFYISYFQRDHKAESAQTHWKTEPSPNISRSTDSYSFNF